PGGNRPQVLAVTVLTSWDEASWARDAASSETIAGALMLRAQQAAAAGVDGLVCSAKDLAALKQTFGDRFIYVCPGIRPGGTGTADDHGRAATPAEAVAAGADYLVIGRPITQSSDPLAAAMAVEAEIAGAVKEFDAGRERGGGR
ncbi:MAG: orotidine-5'-phosphate decarboxylase, partial [Thermaerobacterales bacterium]